MGAGAFLLVLAPLAIPPAVLAWTSYQQGGLTWSHEMASLDAALPLAERAQEAYREYLISRNSAGFEKTATSQLEIARAQLADAAARLEEALDEHRLADGTLPARLEAHVKVLARLRFSLANTERSLKARRDNEATEKRLREEALALRGA